MGKRMSKGSRTPTSEIKFQDGVSQFIVPSGMNFQSKDGNWDACGDIARQTSEPSLLQTQSFLENKHKNFSAYKAPSRLSVGKSVDLMLIDKTLPVPVLVDRPMRVPVSARQQQPQQSQPEPELAPDPIEISLRKLTLPMQSRSVPMVKVVQNQNQTVKNTPTAQIDVNKNSVPKQKPKQMKNSKNKVIIQDNNMNYERIGDAMDQFSDALNYKEECDMLPSATKSTTYTTLNNWAELEPEQIKLIKNTEPPGTAASTSTSASGSTKKKLVVRGLKNFVHTRGGSTHPPSWIRDFPCKSKFHPDNYVYDFEKNSTNLGSQRSPASFMPKQAGAGGPKKGTKCDSCGIYTSDSCRCCKKCPYDCACPKPPTKIPDVMNQAFGNGWTQAQKVICELTNDERRNPIGSNPTKMSYPPPHLKCHIDVLNPFREENVEQQRPANFYQQQGQGNFPPFGYCQPPPPMYPAFYPPPMMPAYMPMPPNYSVPCYSSPQYPQMGTPPPNYY